VIDHESRLLQIRRLGYVQTTTSYSVTSTTVAGAANLFASSITFTADGTSAYRIEFFCPQVQAGVALNASIQANLVDGSGNDLGRLCDTPLSSASTPPAQSLFNAVYFYTPTAGSKTVNARGVYVGATGGQFICGAGGSGNRVPMYLAVYGPPLT
jgi:hypothetical protein